MSRSSDLGDHGQVELAQGTVAYRERGSGRPVVFLHGLLVNGDLWRKVVPGLADRHRCITPDLPLGAHTIPMKADADLTVPGVVALIADFLEALDLRDVVLVANDTAGALTQILITEHPRAADRVGAVVLTSCDAFEVFPPAMFRPLMAMARFPRVLHALLWPLRFASLRRLPIAIGWLAKRPIERRYEDGYVLPFLTDALVRRDCIRFMRNATPAQTLAAAEKLDRFTRPVLLAWAREDRFFKVSLGRRLAARFPDARMELVDDCYTFVPEDQPEVLARLIGEFAAPAASLRAAS